MARMVLAHGMTAALAGIALGLVAALATTRLLASLLYGVSHTDPLTFTVAPLILAAVAVGACWIPARRATRVSPTLAMRE